jgi:hypothetical protein
VVLLRPLGIAGERNVLRNPRSLTGRVLRRRRRSGARRQASGEHLAWRLARARRLVDLSLAGDNNVAASEHLVEAQQIEHRGRAGHEFRPERRTDAGGGARARAVRGGLELAQLGEPRLEHADGRRVRSLLGSDSRLRARLSHKPPIDPVRRSVMGRPTLSAAENVRLVRCEPHHNDESRYVSHQLGSEAFPDPFVQQPRAQAGVHEKARWRLFAAVNSPRLRSPVGGQSKRRSPPRQGWFASRVSHSAQALAFDLVEPDPVLGVGDVEVEDGPDEREAAGLAGEPADHLGAAFDLGQRPLEQVRAAPPAAVSGRVAQVDDEGVEVVGKTLRRGGVARRSARCSPTSA